MMTKFNVGDKIRVLDVGAINYGEDYYYDGMETEVVCMFAGYPVLRGKDGDDAIVIVEGEFHAIERITDKPKKSARITALETQVATLQAKVEALESAGKYPLTERFERESTSMDAILADIERKAKPTLEALLATYPTPNEQRADVIKRAKAFVTEWTKRAARLAKEDGNSELMNRGSMTTEFIVNTDKRTVVCLAKSCTYGSLRGKGIAKCDPSDVFNADIGKAIALARGLGVEVPTEFVKAVQPTEAKVGMKVKRIGGFDTNNGERTLTGLAFSSGTYVSFKTKEGCGATAIENIAKILDDTDAVYE